MPEPEPKKADTCTARVAVHSASLGRGLATRLFCVATGRDMLCATAKHDSGTVKAVEISAAAVILKISER